MQNGKNETQWKCTQYGKQKLDMKQKSIKYIIADGANGYESIYGIVYC